MSPGRRHEPGWVQVGPLDASGSRGLWVRVGVRLVELCAGREGDDAYAVIVPGGPIPPVTLAALYEVATSAAFAWDEVNNRDNALR